MPGGVRNSRAPVANDDGEWLCGRAGSRENSRAGDGFAIGAELMARPGIIRAYVTSKDGKSTHRVTRSRSQKVEDRVQA